MSARRLIQAVTASFRPAFPPVPRLAQPLLQPSSLQGHCAAREASKVPALDSVRLNSFNFNWQLNRNLCTATSSHKQLVAACGAHHLPSAVCGSRLMNTFGNTASTPSLLSRPAPHSGAARTSHLHQPCRTMSAHAGGETLAGKQPMVVVSVTVPSRDVGDKIAEALVEERLAACVQIVPGLVSVYRWEGKVNKDEELLLLIKARKEGVPALTDLIKRHHPYTEPEVVAVPIVGGSASYLQWLLDSTEPVATSTEDAA